MNRTPPLSCFASSATPRALVCLLFCWLGIILNVVALPPPVITTQPTNQTVQVGGNATFVVVATTGTPLAFQWHFQNVRIPGATNTSYTRTNAQLTHAGTYYVALTNSDGWAISSNALLTVNNAPVLDNTKSPALLAQYENASAPSGAVGTLVSSLVDFASPAGQVDNVTDADAGALLGIAVTAANTANGTWYYSTNNGAAWNALGAVSDSSVRLLAADANTRLYFKPNTNWNGTLATAITFRAWDQSSGKNGGTASTFVTNTVLDQFSIAAYSNNDGSANWSTNWVENDDVGSSPTGGNIRIVGGVLSFRPGNGTQNFYREVNLSGASSAVISGTYSNTLGAGDQLEVQVSSNGGATYTTLGTFNSGTNTGSGSAYLDISAYVASNTRIRLAETAVGAKVAMTFDDVQISYVIPVTGGATAFSTATDTASLTVLPVADVVTTKSGPASVFATTNFSYTISVTNLGPATASNIIVSDALPAGISVVSVSGGGTIVGGGPGQVVFDRASSNNISGTLTWTHVTTNAANRLMLVGVSFGNSGATSNSAVTALTYGGSNFTKVLAQTNGVASSELWQLVNPPSGTNTVTITRVGAPTTLVAGAATFSGVDQATPLSAVNSDVGPKSKVPSVTLNSATNEIVFDTVVGDKSTPPVPAAGQTSRWSIGAVECGGASTRPGTNSVTMTWTIQNSAWVDIAASVKPAGLIGVVTWTIPSLANGATTNFTVTVTAPLAGTLSNNVSSSAATFDSNITNNNGSAAAAQVVTTVTPIADVVTTQSGPAVVAPLTNYTYMVTVSNFGPCNASNVVVSDKLSPMLTFVSASAGGTYLAGTVTWPAVASLASGATTNFTVMVRAPLSGSLTNTASSTSATTDLNAINNNGSAPAAQIVTVVSPLQTANTSKGASVSTLNWSHTVSPGSARILVVGVSIDASNSTINSATYANILPLTLLGQTNGTQSKVAMYYLINPPVGTYPVSINLNTASGIVGGAVSFNGVNQANPIAGFRASTGTGSLASVTVASTLGAVVVDTFAPKSPQSATNSGPAQNLEWNLSGINYSGAGSTMPGAPTVSPSYTLDSPAAWAMGAVALNPATILADITVGATGLAGVLATSNLTYTLMVTNLGNSSASNVVVSDVLPAGATFVSASSGGTFGGGVVTWPTLASFINGARTNYTVTITVPANGSLTNIVYITAFTADPDPSNNNGAGPNNQVVTSVTPLADIATTVTGPAVAITNTPFSYTVTVTNRGPSVATSVAVSDTLPAGATFVSASSGGTHIASVVTWSLPSLLSGAATNFTVTVNAPGVGRLTNMVASSAVIGDPDLSNNDGSAISARLVTGVYPLLLLTGQRLSGADFQVEFHTHPDTSVSIQATTNLVDWVTLITTNSGDGHVIFIDPNATNYPVRFYRSQQGP